MVEKSNLEILTPLGGVGYRSHGGENRGTIIEIGRGTKRLLSEETIFQNFEYG